MNSKLNSYCKNYNVIVNCEFLEDDLFSHKLVEFYKNAVSKANSDENMCSKVTRYDKVMRRYIEDYDFSKKLKNSVDVSSIIQSKVDLTNAVLDYAVAFGDKYNDDVDSPVVNTRWI